MSAEALLSRLDKPRRTGPGTWLACCPAHEDRNPSMTVRECDDGRILVRCFGGCSFEDIVGAVGLGFDAFFPPRPFGDHIPPIRRPFPAADVLEAVMHDVLVVQQIAAELLPDANEAARIKLRGIVGRLAAAREAVNG